MNKKYYNNKKRICLISYHLFSHSGASKQALMVSKELAKRGFYFYIIGGTSSNVNYASEENFNIYLFTNRRYESIRKAIFYLYTIRFIFKKYLNIHVLHLIGLPPGWISFILLAHILRIKIIIKLTLLGGDDPLTLKRRRLGCFYIAIFKLIDRIVCTSTELRNTCLKAGIASHQISCIHNGVDINKFTNISSRDRINKLKSDLGFDAKFIAISCGRISKRKGTDDLIDVWYKVCSKYPDVILLLIGASELMVQTKNKRIKKHNEYVKNIREKIFNLNIDKNVQIIGWVNNVEFYYQIADIYMSASVMEGMSNALLEAIATGLPVVTYKTSGTCELVTNGKNGFIVEIGDKRMLYKLTLKLIESDPLRKKYSKYALNKVETYFTLNYISSLYQKLYLTIG